MSVWSMAWRNLWRNARRTGVTIAAMAFALWVMVLYSGLVQGMIAGMQGDVLDFEVGELQAWRPGYDDDPSLDHRIPDTTAAVAALEGAGFRVAPRLLAGGLAAHGDQSAGVVFRGIDVARDGATLRLSERLADGAWLDPTDPKGVVVGRRLARTLAVKPGDELVALSQGADGSVANDLFTVRGVLGTVGDATDRAAVFLVEEAFRELMVVPEGAHLLILRAPPGRTPDEARALALATTPDLEVRTWRQLMPIVAQMLDGTQATLFIVFVVVYLAIGILILNAMLMAVFERIREFGVMKAIGVGPGLVFRLILVETAMQVGLAMAVGLTLAAPCAVWLARVGLNVGALSGTSMLGMAFPPRWKGIYTPETVAGPVLVLLLIVSGAVIWPAVKAARLRPLDAMRYT